MAEQKKKSTNKRQTKQTVKSKSNVNKISNCISKFDVHTEDNSNIEVQNNKIDINDPNVCYFSVPMPFDTKVIDRIASLNNDYKKCKVGTFLNNMPTPFSTRFNEWFQVNRGQNAQITSYEQFGEVAAYAKSKGFDVCYLMNSPKPFSKNDFGYVKNHVYPLLEMLKKYGIDYIKCANTQVATIINHIAPGFRISSSTACEYHTITQYRYLLDEFPNIEFIDMTSEENHNFPLLKNLRKEFPKVRIEIMVNEACLKGCPARISHASELRFCMFNCNGIRTRIGTAVDMCKSPIVYPWFIPEYLKLGINNFKIVPSHNDGMRGNYRTLFPLQNYMDFIEYGTDNMTVNKLFRDIFSFYDNTNMQIPEDVMVNEIINILPKASHFIKNGAKCASSCGVDCRYCFKCAEKLEKFISKKGGYIKPAQTNYREHHPPVWWEPNMNPDKDLRPHSELNMSNMECINCHSCQ